MHIAVSRFLEKRCVELGKKTRFAGSRRIRVEAVAVLFLLLIVSSVAFVHAETYVCALKWGTSGSGDGQLIGPRGVAVDGSGNVYVADTNNHRVQKFAALTPTLSPTTITQENIIVQAASFDSTHKTVTMYVQSTGGLTPVVNSIIIKDASGSTIATVGIASISPTATGNALAKDKLYSIQGVAFTNVLGSGTYTATITTAAGGSYISPTSTISNPNVTPTRTPTPTPTSSTVSPVVSTSFWSENLLALVSVSFVGVVSVFVSVVSFRRLKASRRTLCDKLIFKGEGLVEKNDLMGAVECFAKASIAGFKLKSNVAAVKALEFYTATAKILIITSVLGGAKTEKDERVSKLQRKITRTLSDKSVHSLIAGSILDGVSGLDLLISKAGDNDLDFVVDAAFKIHEVEHSFLEAFSGLDEFLIADLAAKLGYTLEATFRLLSKGISLKKIEGYISSDYKKFFSREHVRKQLSTHL